MFFIEKKCDENIEISRIKAENKSFCEKLKKNERIRISHHETLNLGQNGTLKVKYRFVLRKLCFFFLVGLLSWL